MRLADVAARRRLVDLQSFTQSETTGVKHD